MTNSLRLADECRQVSKDDRCQIQLVSPDAAVNKQPASQSVLRPERTDLAGGYGPTDLRFPYATPTAGRERSKH